MTPPAAPTRRRQLVLLKTVKLLSENYHLATVERQQQQKQTLLPRNKMENYFSIFFSLPNATVEFFCSLSVIFNCENRER